MSPKNTVYNRVEIYNGNNYAEVRADGFLFSKDEKTARELSSGFMDTLEHSIEIGKSNCVKER